RADDSGGRSTGRGDAGGRGGGGAGRGGGGAGRGRRGGMSVSSGGSGSRRLLLTFRVDREQRQRLKARLAREGRTMSEVVTHGLRQYVQRARHTAAQPDSSAAGRPAFSPVLPERVADGLRELRS